MDRSDTGRRRVVRLVLAGVLWVTALLVAAVLAAPGVAPAVRLRSETESLRVERGRLPADAGTNVRSASTAASGASRPGSRRDGLSFHCQSPEDWKRRTDDSSWRVLNDLGPWRAHTSVDRRAIHLSPEVRAAREARRRRVIRSGADADASAWSVAALAYEAQHAAGFSNEVQADCFGMQFIETAGDEARYLATVYARHWYPWHDASYRSDECRNGGALDLRPGVDDWP